MQRAETPAVRERETERGRKRRERRRGENGKKGGEGEREKDEEEIWSSGRDGMKKVRQKSVKERDFGSGGR